MSQLTFGDEFKTSSPCEPSKAKMEQSKTESWYKGRVLSHSSVTTYQQCPQKWKFRYIDKIPEKPRSFFSFGKSVHSGLEFIFSSIHEVLPGLEEVLANYKNQWIRDGYETAAQEKWFYQEGERILKGFYAKHRDDRGQVKWVEYKFQMSLDGIPVMGYIDRIDETPHGGLAIIDYKTGKSFDKTRARKDPQLTLYQMACRELLKKDVETLTLYHLNSLTPFTVSTHSAQLEVEVKAKVIDTAKGITAEKYDPKPDEKGYCQWCDYLQICPAFAKKKSSVLSRSLSQEPLADAADRFGQVEMKIQMLVSQKEELRKSLLKQLENSEKGEIQGKYFTVRLEEKDSSKSIKVESKSLRSN